MSESEAAPTRELLLGADDLPFFANTRGVFSVDTELVRVRIYAPDGKALLADIGARFIAGANKIDPQGAVVAAAEAAGDVTTIGGAKS
jgi:hypothetical protein